MVSPIPAHPMQAQSELTRQAASAIDSAADLAALDAVRVSYLGKNGELTRRLKNLSSLPAAERPAAGQEINAAKKSVQALLNEKRGALEDDALAERLAADKIDLSLPGRGVSLGGRHPVSRAAARIEKIFRDAGFGVMTGP